MTNLVAACKSSNGIHASKSGLIPMDAPNTTTVAGTSMRSAASAPLAAPVVGNNGGGGGLLSLPTVPTSLPTGMRVGEPTTEQAVEVRQWRRRWSDSNIVPVGWTISATTPQETDEEIAAAAQFDLEPQHPAIAEILRLRAEVRRLTFPNAKASTPAAAESRSRSGSSGGGRSRSNSLARITEAAVTAMTKC